LFEELQNAQVYLPGILLKPNMIVPGEKSGEKVVSELIAQKTIQELKECVPDTVPGIVFLSGGQSEIEATVNLNVMNLKKDLPWKLSFSYGRALQASALNAWSGKSENIAAAQDEFLKRARLNSLACSGEYQSE
jgi:fructose-bisphosphate aldolase class I